MAKTLIATQTASASSSLSFTSGIDSTYSVYEFLFTTMHPSIDVTQFQFQVNASGQTGFNEQITSTFFYAYNEEVNPGSGIFYDTTYDKALGTTYQTLDYGTGTDNDQSVSGTLTLYNPSGTSSVKKFMSKAPEYYWGNAPLDSFIAGYINTTNAITEINFKFSSGNIDSGTIKMFGVS